MRFKEPTSFSSDRHKACLTFDDHKICCKVVTKDHEPHIGTWNKDTPTVYVDDDMGKLGTDLDVQAIILHEMIERYLSTVYKMPENGEAHRIAEKFEKQYIKKNGGNWEKHEWLVSKVFDKENPSIFSGVL